MKKTILIVALAGSVTLGAQAQSAVTIFGVADVGVVHVDNGGDSQFLLSSSGLTTSRFGFRGTEDLGNGMQAGFWLEHGLNWDTGTLGDTAKFWNRRASVSLMGNFGEVRLGRFLTAQYLGYGNFDPFSDTGLGAVGKLTSTLSSAAATNATTKVRADNLVSYLLPKDLGGVYGQFDVAAGEGVAASKYVGGLLGYAAGPLDVAGSFGTTDLSGGKYKVLTLGINYKLAVATLTGGWHEMKNTANGRKLVHVLLGAQVPVGAGAIRGTISTANASGGGTDANDARMLALGYVHNLSKRTALYATYATIDNDGAATFTVATGPAAVAGATSSGFNLGIRHSF